MAYTIIRSDGTTLTTIQDGTINTTSTSLALPGRNYAGYGQSLDTNQVRILESWANTSPPPNPLRGQLWFNTNEGTLCVCPADGTTTATDWITLAATGTDGTTTFGDLVATGNIQADNLSITGDIIGDTITVRLATVTEMLTSVDSELTVASIGTLTTQSITSGSVSTSGAIQGLWTINGSGAEVLTVTGGNIATAGIRTDNYYWANGEPYVPTGTYGNGNVYSYLNDHVFTGSITPSYIQTQVITTGGVGVGGTITGTWTLTAGSQIEATYADFAERFAADAEYDTGTVVEIGGDEEITAVVDELSDTVFGVVSTKAAYILNAAAGSDKTHPAIALKGRVPVKVKGTVKKGDRLVSAGKGYARAAKKSEWTAFNIIGRALEHKTTADAGTVMAIVSIK
jgi:hypothetical protein